jgi:cyclic-di-AMP phosphodiesterase PgpH
MSILEKMGLGQKKPESAPNIGKKRKKKQKEVQEKKNRYLRVVIFLSFLAIIFLTLPQPDFQPVGNFSEGEPWRSDDLTAPFTFSLLKTAEELQEEREEIRRQTPPVFHINENAQLVIGSELDAAFRSLQPVLDSYLQWQQSLNDDASSVESDSLRYIQERNFSDIQLSDDSWNLLLANYYEVITQNQPRDQLITTRIKSELETITLDLLRSGIINREKTSLNRNDITIRNLQQRTERRVSLANTRDIREAQEYASIMLNREFESDVAMTALQIFTQYIRPNWIYSEEDTEAILEENLSEISTTRGAVEQGEIIVRRGDLVTDEQANKLRSLAEARAATADNLERWLRYAGEALVILIASLLFLIYIYLYRRSIFDKPSMFLLVFLALTLITLSSAIVYPIGGLNSYIVPIAVAPIILTIIFDSRVGLMATITLAIITGIVHDNSFEYLVATTAACTLGVFSVRDIKKRSQFFFITPGIVFVTYSIILVGFTLARYSGIDRLLTDLSFIAINAVFILFTYPLILLFEKLFKITTDFTLLELADTNLPLLKDLMNKAPGTFHHSLQIANMAESAASEIGANPLLCRVGAMYHDIGKMEKPGYFIENQSAGNDHDKLKPRMSSLVIKAHVSDGVKMAKENNLPQVVIDFIQTHHGTSLIKYFYGKAKDQAEDGEVDEKDFRYDGPLPFTKEQGIILLADGIEAASRAMKDPNYNKLENLINRMVDDHIGDGQLNNCPLTFRQIEIIKKSFLNILVGVYHSRIDYPEDKKEKQRSNRRDQVQQQQRPYQEDNSDDETGSSDGEMDDLDSAIEKGQSM